MEAFGTCRCFTGQGPECEHAYNPWHLDTVIRAKRRATGTPEPKPADVVVTPAGPSSGPANTLANGVDGMGGAYWMTPGKEPRHG